MIARLIESFLQMPVLQNNHFYTGDTGIHLLKYRENNQIIHFIKTVHHILKNKWIIQECEFYLSILGEAFKQNSSICIK